LINCIFCLDTYEKGLFKLKKEFISDINSESDDSEELKKSRKNRAKKIISNSDDNATDDDKRIQLSPYPKVPHMKKACDIKMSTSYNKSKQL